jgi:FKBP12-rapamycin complex-associated protein
MHLGQWEKLERYNEKVGTESVDKPLWNAAISIHKNDLETARMWVAKSRERLDAQVSGLLLESYERAQEGILKLQ